MRRGEKKGLAVTRSATLVVALMAASGCASSVEEPRTAAVQAFLVLPPEDFAPAEGVSARLSSRRDEAEGNRASWAAAGRSGALIITSDVTRTTNGRVHESSRTRTRTWTAR